MKITTALVCMTIVSFLAAGQPNDENADDAVLTQRVTAKGPRDIQFDVYSVSGELFSDKLKVYDDGELVYTNDEDLYQGAYELLPATRLIHGASQDIDGDGRDEVVVRWFTGGAHCCYGYQFFSVADGVRLLAEIKPDNLYVKLSDVDGDNVAECQFSDTTFLYWNTAYAFSPHPRVIAVYEGGDFRLAGGLMRAHPSVEHSDDEAADRFQEAFSRTGAEADPPGEKPWEPLHPETWSLLLDYIYSGRAADGWRLFEHAWPEEKVGFDDFKKAFQETLETSPYYEELTAMQE